MKILVTAMILALSGPSIAGSWIVSKGGAITKSSGRVSKNQAFCAANPDVAIAFTESLVTVPAQTRIRENSAPIGLQTSINVQAVCLSGTSQIRLRYGAQNNSTAIEGQDFLPISVQVSTGALAQFSPPTNANANGSIAIIDDNIQELDENIQLGIVNGELIVNTDFGSQIILLEAGDDAAVVLTIEDDDDLNPNRISGILGPAVAGDPVAAAAVGPFAATCAAEAALPPAQQSVALIAQCQAILANPQNAIAALRAISGEEFSSQITTGQNSANFANQGVNARLAALRGGATRQSVDEVALNWNGKSIPMAVLAAMFGMDADEPSSGNLLDRRVGIFFSGTARNGDKNENNFEVGFDYEGFQALGGIDYRFSNKFVGGLAIGFSKMDTDLDRDAGYLDTQSISSSLYGNYYPSEGWYVDLSLGYLKNDYDQGRVIDLLALGGNFNRVIARGSNTGRQYSISGSSGYTFGTGQTTLTPNIRVSYADTRIDGFTESGGGINDLIFPDQYFKSLQYSFGINVSHAISTSRGVVQPYASVDFSREQKNEAFNFNPILRIRPNQVSTPIFIAEADRGFGRADMGVVFLFENGFQISASYSQLFGFRDLTARSFSLTGRIEF